MSLAAMIGYQIGAELPPPLIDVMSRQEVIIAMVGLIVAALGAIAGGFVTLGKWLNAKVEASIAEMAGQTKATDRKVQDTAEKVAEVKEHVANTHDTNFRDDMDAFRDEMRDLLSKQDQKLDRQDQKMDRQDRKLDRSLGEVRRDIQGINDRSLEEHRRIHDEIATKQDKT